MTNPAKVSPGDQVHVLGALTLSFEGGLFGRSEVVDRGTTLTLTSTLIDLNRDARRGGSVFDLVHHPDEQVRRWGSVLLAPGAWPIDKPTWTHGDQAWAEARAAALGDAWDVRDERKRDEALREVRVKFGLAPTSLTTLTHGGAGR